MYCWVFSAPNELSTVLRSGLFHFLRSKLDSNLGRFFSEVAAIDQHFPAATVSVFMHYLVADYEDMLGSDLMMHLTIGTTIIVGGGCPFFDSIKLNLKKFLMSHVSGYQREQCCGMDSENRNLRQVVEFRAFANIRCVHYSVPSPLSGYMLIVPLRKSRHK